MTLRKKDVRARERESESGLTVRQDVDGLVVDVEKATEALADGHERPVAGEDVRIELEVLRHVAPSSQEQELGRRLLRMRRLGIAAGHPLVVLTPRSVRVGVLLVRRARDRRRMARSLVVPERRTRRARYLGGRGIGPASGRDGGASSPPRAVSRASSQRRRRRHCTVLVVSCSWLVRAARKPPVRPLSPAAAVIRTRFGLSDGPVATATASIPSLGRLGVRRQPHRERDRGCSYLEPPSLTIPPIARNLSPLAGNFLTSLRKLPFPGNDLPFFPAAFPTMLIICKK